MKDCPKCKEIKPAGEFYQRDNNKPYGRCISCCKKYYRERKEQPKKDTMQQVESNYYFVNWNNMALYC